MSDNSCFVGIGAVLAPLEKLLVESFGRVFGLATFGLSADAYSGGADGSVLPFSFNDISATAAARVYKLQFFWIREPENTQAMWLHGLPFTLRSATVGEHVPREMQSRAVSADLS